MNARRSQPGPDGCLVVLIAGAVIVIAAWVLLMLAGVIAP